MGLDKKQKTKPLCEVILMKSVYDRGFSADEKKAINYAWGQLVISENLAQGSRVKQRGKGRSLRDGLIKRGEEER